MEVDTPFPSKAVWQTIIRARDETIRLHIM